MKLNQRIKILSLVALVGSMSMLQSCNKALQNLHFNLGMQTQTVTVKIPPTSGSISIGPLSNSYNVDSFIKANTGQQLGVANISSVKLSSCVLTLNNSSLANNFANFQSCSASFYTNTNSTPVSISIADNPDVSASTLSLPVDANLELKSYIGDQFTYNFAGSLRRPTTDTLVCTIAVTYNVIVQG